MTKICHKCFCERPLTAFSVSGDRIFSPCKKCKREYMRQRYVENPEKVCASNEKWRKENPEKFAAICKGWTTRNPERRREIGRSWARRNQKTTVAKARQWRAENPELARKKRLAWYAKTGKAQDNFKLACCLRARVLHALSGKVKAATTLEMLGCSIEELRTHLENQFYLRPGMSWETRCFWEIDHIRPCKDFILSDPEQQKLCFHYTNLQPLWTLENQKKGGRYF